MQRLIRHGERRTFDTGVLREGGNCRSVLYALGVLLVCLLGSYLFLFPLEHVRVLQEREKARYVVDSYATKIQYVVANAFSSAYLVEALLRQGEGRISEFYSYAEELVKMHPSTININLAPRGVVTKVYPFERNKKAIGHDLFANPERSREALLARLPELRAACELSGVLSPYDFPGCAPGTDKQFQRDFRADDPHHGG